MIYCRRHPHTVDLCRGACCTTSNDTSRTVPQTYKFTLEDKPAVGNITSINFGFQRPGINCFPMLCGNAMTDYHSNGANILAVVVTTDDIYVDG